ncbi:hypothetical protein PybrP1_004545 [[Pythium] brassicae (nom. inval.)]|nr:hypothetical protein PybrP1_004545 [[Pythium] brassicae (nom. inval.)]
MVDATTRAWLKTELTTALGFDEVDDIVAYVCGSFSSKREVVPYLTELLGIPPSRAEAIGERLYSAPTSAPQKQQQQQQRGSAEKRASAKSGLHTATVSLVPPATEPNSRLRQAKQKKTGVPKLMHARVINCLQCGRIEHNGGRVCAFCSAELRYEELDEHELDSAARRHMETLVLYDETSAERTVVVDADEELYEEVTLGGDERQRAIVLNLDLGRRQFVQSAPRDAIRRNHELSKDARELCDGIQRRLGRAGGGRQQRASTPVAANEQHERSLEAALLGDDAELVFV